MSADTSGFNSNRWFLIAAVFLMPVQGKADVTPVPSVIAARSTAVAQSTVRALTPTPTLLPVPSLTPVASKSAVVSTVTPAGTLTATATITKTGTVTPTSTITATGTPTPTPGVFHFKISPHPVQGSLHFEWGANMQSQEVDLIVYTSSFRPVRRFIFSPANRVDFLIPGVHEFVWNGLDDENRPLVPGTYLCFIDVKVRKSSYEASGDFATP